jgi:hypothetical protein
MRCIGASEGAVTRSCASRAEHCAGVQLRMKGTTRPDSAPRAHLAWDAARSPSGGGAKGLKRATGGAAGTALGWLSTVGGAASRSWGLAAGGPDPDTFVSGSCSSVSEPLYWPKKSIFKRQESQPFSKGAPCRGMAANAKRNVQRLPVFNGIYQYKSFPHIVLALSYDRKRTPGALESY